ILVGHGRERAVPGETRIEHGTIVRTMSLDIGFQNGAAGGPIGRVEGEEPSVTASLADCRPSLIGARAVPAVMHRDPETILGQVLGNGTADAFAGPGNEDSSLHSSVPVAVASGNVMVSSRR